MIGARGDASLRLGDRIVIASNRLPVALERREDGGWDVERGSGGLVTALTPVLERHEGVWVGWPGTVEADAGELAEPLGRVSDRAGFRMRPVELSVEERDNYYYGFSNEVLWPLLHDLLGKLRFDPDYWNAYVAVNRKFASVLAGVASPGDYVWVHDYHLMMAARHLREMGVKSRLGYYLHTPFPSLDILMKLPWRAEILEGLLQYDLLGFQTLRDRSNFLACVRVFRPEARLAGRGPVTTCRVGDREVRVGAFPISIDFAEFVEAARSAEVEEQFELMATSLRERDIILGVDRLDYTKGIPHRLDAYRAALEKYPILRGNVSLVQVVVPSRERIQEYGDLRSEIERQVGEINGRFGRAGWVPVHYHYRSLDRPELVAYYRKARAALVTPLKDGMNLVSKEFCAASLDEEGVLILSEFAGSAAELQDGALLVNPFDVEGTADAIYRAFTMERGSRRTRMSGLREVVREHDVYRWLESYSRAATGERMDELPPLREYVPARASPPGPAGPAD